MTTTTTTTSGYDNGRRATSVQQSDGGGGDSGPAMRPMGNVLKSVKIVDSLHNHRTQTATIDGGGQTTGYDRGPYPYYLLSREMRSVGRPARKCVGFGYGFLADARSSVQAVATVTITRKSTPTDNDT